MTPESKVIKKICGWVSEHGGVSYKIHVEQFGPNGFPDLVVILPEAGTVHVEAKAKGKRPSRSQVVTMDEINRHGGRAFWCDSLDEFIEKIA